jgi:hypothetical protein
VGSLKVGRLHGKKFATQRQAMNVSDAQGSVRRFGNTVLVVPVTLSALAMVKHAYAFATGDRSKSPSSRAARSPTAASAACASSRRASSICLAVWRNRHQRRSGTDG